MKSNFRLLRTTFGCLLTAFLLWNASCGASGAPPVSIPAPSPAKIRVTSPDENGLVTISGSAGAVTDGNIVRVTNLTASGAAPLIVQGEITALPLKTPIWWTGDRSRVPLDRPGKARSGQCSRALDEGHEYLPAPLQALMDLLIPSAWAQVATRVEVTANADGSFTVQIAASVGDVLSIIQINPTTNEQSGVTEIATPGNAPPLTFSPTAITVDAAGLAYAVGSSGGTGLVAIIDLATNAVTGMFDLATNDPRAIDFNPTNNKLVVVDTTNNAVVFITLADPATQNTVSVTGAQSVAVDTVSNRAIVGTTHPTNSVVLINLTTETVAATGTIVNATDPTIAYQGSPAVDALNGQAAIVSNFADGSSQITTKDLTVPVFTNFEVVADSTLQGVAMTGANQALAADASGNRVLFADLTGATPFVALAVGEAPRAVAFDAGDNEGLIVNAGDHTVSVVDLGARSVSQTQDVGLSPQGIAHFAGTDRAAVANGGNNSVTILP